MLAMLPSSKPMSRGNGQWGKQKQYSRTIILIIIDNTCNQTNSNNQNTVMWIPQRRNALSIQNYSSCTCHNNILYNRIVMKYNVDWSDSGNFFPNTLLIYQTPRNRCKSPNNHMIGPRYCRGERRYKLSKCTSMVIVHSNSLREIFQDVVVSSKYRIQWEGRGRKLKKL